MGVLKAESGSWNGGINWISREEQRKAMSNKFVNLKILILILMFYQ